MTTPIIGVIRWDGWYPTAVGETTGIPAEVGRICGDSDLQPYTPIHWQSVNSYTVRPMPATQAIIDNEISVAIANGVGFWTFLRYGEVNGGPDNAPEMNNAWNFYQTSSLRNSLPWATMTQVGLLGSTGNFSTQVAQYVSWFQQSCYFMVLGNRPLFTIYWLDPDFQTYWGGSYANVAAMITALRAACSAAGIGNPYVVVLPASNTTISSGIGADAIGFYNPPVLLTPNMTYAAYDTAIRAAWVNQAATGVPNVLTLSSGWINQARLRRPDGFELVYPRMGQLGTVVRPTAAELKAHVAAGSAFITANPTAFPANIGLLYAWSEWYEGNGIGPTRIAPGGQALV